MAKVVVVAPGAFPRCGHPWQSPRPWRWMHGHSVIFAHSGRGRMQQSSMHPHQTGASSDTQRCAAAHASTLQSRGSAQVVMPVAFAIVTTPAPQSLTSTSGS
ncbi:unnamed protein product [Symbiodinium sp. CCMP2592]|nr:unnamed protein product [Symbiodinium sp. CCMP2592]